MRTPPNYTPEVGMRVRRLPGFDHAGRIFTIEEVIPRLDDFASIRGRWEDGGEGRFDAERFEPLEPAEVVIPEIALANFVIGQEVVISERVTTPEDRCGHQDACSVVARNVGQECLVESIRASNGWVLVSWNNGHNSRWLPSQYLDAAKPPSLNFAASWKLAMRGTPIPVLMDHLWPKIAAPIQNLSREKGDWNSLLISRAILRLRRQMPNSYEEAVAKDRDWGSIWLTAWSALVQ